MTWPAHETKFLRDHWQTMPRKDIAARLNRSLQSVASCAKRLGLVATKRCRPRENKRPSGIANGNIFFPRQPNREYISRRARERVKAEQKRAAVEHAIAQVLPPGEAEPFRNGFCFCGKTRLRPYAYCETHRPKPKAAA